jgi:nucleotide-binding universal stress UspA family protein
MTQIIDRDCANALPDFQPVGSPAALEPPRPAGSIEAVAGTHDAMTRPAPVVLLLLDYYSASAVAIQRAVEIAEQLSGYLLVALAMPYGIEERHPGLVKSRVTTQLTQLSPGRNFRVEVVHGPAHDVGIEMVRATSPALVIVDPSLGAEACWMVDALGVPVLVARDARPHGQLIATSDMQQRTLPVLSIARDFARIFKRQVMFFHNARPTPLFVAEPSACPPSYDGLRDLQEDIATAKHNRLRSFAGAASSVEAVVWRAPHTVDAILQVARDRDADIVVLGHRRRSWFRRLVGGSITERILEQSRRSILVVPISTTT